MNTGKMTCGVVGTCLAYVFGSLDAMFVTLLIFISIDFLSGFVCAWIRREFTSSKFYLGGVKKIGIVLIIAVAAQLDHILLGDQSVVRTAALSYYIACEGFSILENWGGLGLPLPKAVKNALKKLREDDDNDNQ